MKKSKTETDENGRFQGDHFHYYAGYNRNIAGKRMLMSEKYSKVDLRHIAEDIIEDLRECEDGTGARSGRMAWRAWCRM